MTYIRYRCILKQKTEHERSKKMARIEIIVKHKSTYTYIAPAYTYGTETRYIHTFEAEDGKIYVWKTTSPLTMEVKKKIGNVDDYGYLPINNDAIIKIAATVKGETEYKGTPQTVINRVIVKEIICNGKTKEERLEEKRREQIDSLNEKDFIWEMPYRQYKKSYSDCETLAGSYTVSDYEPARIKVIIREGRLKNSGVRGLHYSGYQIMNDKGEKVTYRAISETTALARYHKEYPEVKEYWVEHIYQYM